MKDKLSSSRIPGLSHQRCGRDAETAMKEPFLEDHSLNRVAGHLRGMPDFKLDPNMVSAVMERLQPIKRPLWFRLLRWSKKPRSFTITPLKLAPLMLILVVVGLVYFGSGYRGISSQEPIAVTLSFRMPGVQSVAVVGSFSGWAPVDCKLHGEATTWTVTLHLPRGRYEYAFLVDGETLVPDPHARLYQADGFGNRNAVLTVGKSNEKAI